ncbi:MAG TPA: hypothetical protein VJW23_00215, partial [Propionibacteriaceae bacterium]|nr:hypothetical protein [Propionibacteriaceae bacterium]
ADLHAGRGNLVFNGHRFSGSPLIFLDIAQREQLQHQALFFEQDPAELAQLHAAVSHLNGTMPVLNGDPCEVGMRRWLASIPSQWNRLGLVYADPIAKEIPHALLAAVAKKLPQVDLLSYVSATAYKRRRGVDLGRGRLDEHIHAVGKKYVRIREPLGMHQWTFILWTNWDKFPEWRNIGLYRLESEHGTRILNRLTMTSEEWHAATNTPLFEVDQ